MYMYFMLIIKHFVRYFIYPVVFPTVTGIPGPPAFPLIGSLIPYIKNVSKQAKINVLLVLIWP